MTAGHRAVILVWAVAVLALCLAFALGMAVASCAPSDFGQRWRESGCLVVTTTADVTLIPVRVGNTTMLQAHTHEYEAWSCPATGLLLTVER